MSRKTFGASMPPLRSPPLASRFHRSIQGEQIVAARDAVGNTATTGAVVTLAAL
jgi:hypothetical protein